MRPPAGDNSFATFADLAELPLELFSVLVGHDGVEGRPVHYQASGLCFESVGEVGVRLVHLDGHVFVRGGANVDEFVIALKCGVFTFGEVDRLSRGQFIFLFFKVQKKGLNRLKLSKQTLKHMKLEP